MIYERQERPAPGVASLAKNNSLSFCYICTLDALGNGR